MSFKIGDKVKIVKILEDILISPFDDQPIVSTTNLVGITGEVVEIEPSSQTYQVRTNSKYGLGWFFDDELNLITEE
jgi:hypothetical protein